MKLSTSPVAYYPRGRAKWDYRRNLLRLKHIDEKIAEHRNSNNSLNPALAKLISDWEEPLERDYYLLPLQQILPLATTSPLQLRALIALSIIWQIREGHRARQLGRRYKGKQIYATTAAGTTSKHALRYMPHLTPHQLACLCYPHTRWETLTRKHSHRAKQSLARLEAKQHIAVITLRDDYWQIAKPYTEPWI